MDVQRHTLQRQHTHQAIADRIASSTRHSYLGDFVLGAVDGAVTTFAIVAGAAGAGFSSAVALVLGVANVLADGFSMAAGNYLKVRADHQVVDRFRRLEETHIDEIPEGEREEIRQIFAAKGFDGSVLEEIVEVITMDRQRWVDTMLTEEWGLQLQPPLPMPAALSTMAAFVLAGMIPLIPLFFDMRGNSRDLFAVTCFSTGLAFFLIGAIRGHLTEQNAWTAGLETLFIGGSAAAVAYAMGSWLRGFIGV